MSRFVWFRNLKNEEAMARVRPQGHKKKPQYIPEQSNKEKHYMASIKLFFADFVGSEVS